MRRSLPRKRRLKKRRQPRRRQRKKRPQRRRPRRRPRTEIKSLPMPKSPKKRRNQKRRRSQRRRRRSRIRRSTRMPVQKRRLLSLTWTSFLKTELNAVDFSRLMKSSSRRVATCSTLSRWVQSTSLDALRKLARKSRKSAGNAAKPRKMPRRLKH